MLIGKEFDASALPIAVNNFAHSCRQGCSQMSATLLTNGNH